MLVTTEQLRSFLNEHAGQNRICTVTSLTPAKMVVKHRETKAPNPFMVQGESIVDHLQERLVNFGADYAKAVNRVWAGNEAMIDEEGFIPYFVAEALWRGKGERINNYMAKHKETGEEYLVYLQAIRGERNISLRQEAWVNRLTGAPVQYADIAPYLSGGGHSQKQRLEEGNIEIVPRTIHIENVLSIRSFDLAQPGRFEVIQLHREPGQISV
jgi:hypothetical protein